MNKIIPYNTFSLNENYIFIDNPDDVNINTYTPPFSFSDKITLKDNALDIHLQYSPHDSTDSRVENFLNNNIGDVFTIKEFVFNTINKIWHIKIELNGKKLPSLWICSKSFRLYNPNYLPKGKNLRVLESIQNEYKHDRLIIKVNSKDEAFQVLDYCNDLYNVKNISQLKNLRGYEYPNYLFIYTDDIFNNEPLFMSYYCEYVVDEDEINDYIIRYKNTDTHIYNINELYKVKYIMKNKKHFIPPTYKPKGKNIRLLESKKYKYNELCVRVNSVEDAIKVLNYCDNIKKIKNKDFILNKIIDYNYPNYVFINIDKQLATFWSYNTSNDTIINGYIGRYPNIDPRIYEMNELNIINNIIKYNIDEVSYKPKGRPNRSL